MKLHDLVMADIYFLTTPWSINVAIMKFANECMLQRIHILHYAIALLRKKKKPCNMANSSFPDWNSYEFIASELIEMEISLTLFLFDIESLQKNSWVRLKSKQILDIKFVMSLRMFDGHCPSDLLLNSEMWCFRPTIIFSNYM